MLITNNLSMSSWKDKVANKRLTCRNAIPMAWKVPQEILANLKTPLETSKNNIIELQLIRRSGVLTEDELNITESYDVEQLLDALASGRLTSVDVVTAYSKRAAVSQQLVRPKFQFWVPDTHILFL